MGMKPPSASSHAIILAVSLLLPLVGCGGADAPAPEEAPEMKDEAGLRLYVMNCGTLSLEDVTPFNLTAEEAGSLDMVVPCYLIEHEEGRLLWDLGLPLAVRDGTFPSPGAQLALERSVVEQLADLDLTPADIDYIAMSHLHFDHCGQAADFAGAHHLIQRAEHEAAFVDEPQVFGFDPALYGALADSETTLLEGHHDVFGDGRVVIRSTPGHTPGHQTLFVDLEQTGPILLSGDLYHFPANRELRRPPHFNSDAEQTLASMEATETFLATSGTELWIEHDATLFANLETLPAFYR